MVEPTPRKICQELDIQKPVRWSKLSSSNSEENTSIQSDTYPSQTQTTEDAPPAIPPRVPLSQDKSKTPGHNLTPVHRGGIALPQPTAEEWRFLHPSSPNHSSSPIVPHRVAPPPPTSPLLPHRVPPPQPSKTGRDDRRLSNISGHSINQAIKGWYKSKHAINLFSSIFSSETSDIYNIKGRVYCSFFCVSL